MELEFSKRDCPVCRSNDESRVFAESNFDFEQLDEFAFASRKMPEYMHYRLIDCGSCDLLYSNPIPKTSHLDHFYHEADFDSSEEADLASQTYGTFLDRIIPHLPDTKGAIDIGTGTGGFIDELIRRGFTEVTGIEPSVKARDAARADLKPMIKQGIFKPEDFDPGTLSLVSCFQTLEHVPNPAKMTQEAFSLLKPGGAVFFVMHNRRSLSAKILGTKSPIFDIEHLQLFSRKSARTMLADAGFSRIEFHTVYNTYPLHYWAKLFPFPSKLKAGIIKRLKGPLLSRVKLTVPAGNLAVIGYK